MSQAKSLQRLQDLDQQIEGARQRLLEIDRQLNDAAEVQLAQHALDTAENQLKPLRKDAKNIEQEVDGTASKIAETEGRLYGGSVKNTKELQEMQQELEHLKNRQANLEESLFTLMMQIDQAESAVNVAQQALEAAQAAHQSQNQALVSEQKQQNEALVHLQKTRDAARTALEAATLTLYDQLKPRIRGAVVSRMQNDGTCTQCGVQQTRSIESDVRRGQLLQCSNCRRILVF